MAIEKLPPEVLADIFELVVNSVSVLDIHKSASNVKFTRVNSLFRAVAISTPKLWGTVSNKQSRKMLHLCLERSRNSNLRVVLLFINHRGPDRLFDFLESVVPHSSRWEEFYFETERIVDDFRHKIITLSKHCHNLRLPNLLTLTLLYPDPKFSGWSYRPAIDGSSGYAENAHNPRSHFYCSWVTPNLRRLKARNIIPYHTESIALMKYEVTFHSTYGWFNWEAKALTAMSPYWAELRCLTLRCGTDTLRVTGPPITSNIVLPNLQTISLSFPYRVLSHHHPWPLDFLDFPNITNIDVIAIMDKFHIDSLHEPKNIRTLLQDQTDYAKLQHARISFKHTDTIVSASTFTREGDNTNVRMKLYPLVVDYLSPKDGFLENVREFSSLLHKQSGWNMLSEIIIVNFDERWTEYVQFVFSGWTITPQLQPEEADAEPVNKFADD